MFFGSDNNRDVLKAARWNLNNLDLAEHIKVGRREVMEIDIPENMKQGWVVTNPPYGERLGIDENLLDVYRDLAHQMKTHFKDWNLWVLSGNEKLTGALKLKAADSYPVFNGNIDCRFLNYPIK